MIEFLQSSRCSVMVNYENDFIRAIVAQLKNLRNHDPVNDHHVAKTYRNILTVIDAVSIKKKIVKELLMHSCFQFYHNKNFGLEVSVENLKDFVDQLIHVLVDGRLENCPNGDVYIRVINLHCVKIIEKSDHTKIIW